MQGPVIDPLRYYDLERFLFEDVRGRFQRDGRIGAFDFFSIIIWKANRAKSSVAKRLWKHRLEGEAGLGPICLRLTAALTEAPVAKARMRLLLEDWGFRLPMASAVLTVLWPDEFTVYDTRACGQLGRFQNLGDVAPFDRLWQGFIEFRDTVRGLDPSRSLRDNDRRLWGTSAAQQLAHDITANFRVSG